MKHFFWIFLTIPILVLGQNKINIITEPQHIKIKKSRFQANEVLPVYIDKKFSDGLNLLESADYFLQILPVNSAKKAKKGIAVFFDKSIKNSEGYVLEITKKQIKIKASGNAGVFYALQSLRQLRKSEMAWAQDGKPFHQRQLGVVPCVKIVDTPTYIWRGMHLDVCRHFFTIENIKQYLDLMAMHKMNVFHWHLTEDQGWRLAIDKYPKLIEVGAWRNGSMVGPYKNHEIDSIKYGGFYTKKQIREILDYAKKMYITVVPEIEMPGHSTAAVASYPWLCCSGRQIEVLKQWGVTDDVFCAGKDSVFTFIEDVLKEVMELFPSKYIHIGGDECPKASWKKCPNCQKRMAENGLKDENELQSYFIQRVEKFLNANGRQLIGWDEILEGGLAPNAAVMSWRGTQGGIEAAKQGHKVVMSPGKPCYFDHYQSKDSSEPNAIGGYNPLHKVYQYRPVDSAMDLASAGFVMGAQANVWTEYIYTWSHVQYMVFPRECALADALWKGGQRKEYNRFINSLDVHAKRLDALGVNYCKKWE